MKNLFLSIMIFSVIGLTAQEKHPLKHESGDVVIIASDAAEYYSRKNMQDLKKIQISLMNHEGEADYKKLLDGYITGQMAYNSRSFLDSRRAFEQNQKDIQEQTRKLIEFYKNRINEISREAATVSVELNMSTDAYADEYKNVINKFSKSANTAMNEADSLVQTSNLNDAVYYYKSAVGDFIMVLYYANKGKYRLLTPVQKAEKNIYIDDDYVPEKYLKDLDDSKNELYTANEPKRKKNREYAMRLFNLKPAGETAKETAEAKKLPSDPAKSGDNNVPAPVKTN